VFDVWIKLGLVKVRFFGKRFVLWLVFVVKGTRLGIF